MRVATRLTLLLLLALSSAGVLAHVRLHNPSNGNDLFWSDPNDIGVVISSAGSDDLPDKSHLTALRNAIDAWNAVSGTSARLVEITTPAQQARTDFESSGIHLILWDEDNSTGFFPNGSSTVALTPVSFFSSGQIADADIVFNGKSFSFTTSAEPGRFDVGDVGTHELGHLLGLDHTGWGGGTMYPFVDPSVILHRSLSLDEVNGLRHAYPAAAFGRLRGTVRRLSNGNAVAGAHVVARDAQGRTAGAALASASGGFTLRGLEPGTYTVYANPLDDPVSAANLLAGHAIETSFETTFYGASAVISGTELVELGDLLVGADVALNLGESSDVLPRRAIAGQAQAFSLRGTGLVAGSTLAASDPELVVVPTGFFNTLVTFQVTTPGNAPPGHVDLMVTNPGGDVSVLTAALEITPPSPTVSGVSPSSGAAAGGTALSISGSGFRAGARVVIGDQVYADGAPGGATVISSSAITLTTAATVGGTHDVVVIDATGVEGRRVSAFTAGTNPVVTSVFPPSGDAAGGTSIVLRGSSFLAGLTVRIDGVTQPDVTVESGKRVRVTTLGGLPGGPFELEVENQGGGLASASFVYVDQPDPVLDDVSPARGPSGGGASVTLTGVAFPAGARVFFGVNKDTGAGGVEASDVSVVDASTLSVVAPAHAAGMVNVLVCDPTTQQASVLAASYTFEGGGGGGGGGGCSAPTSARPPSLCDALAGSSWLVLVLGALALARVRRERARATG